MIYLKSFIFACPVFSTQMLNHVQFFVTPMDYSPPDSSVRGILPARILERDSHFLLQGIFLTQIELGLLHLPHWQAGSLPLCHLGSLI